MKHLQRPWSEEESALCLKYWAEGHSAKECAERLGTGRSRNSIIGLVHRTGVQRRTSTPVRRVRLQKTPRKLSSDRARNMAITRWSTRPPKPAPAQKVHIDPTSPAARAAMALLAAADEAQRRRDGFRATLR